MYSVATPQIVSCSIRKDMLQYSKQSCSFSQYRNYTKEIFFASRFRSDTYVFTVSLWSSHGPLPLIPILKSFFRKTLIFSPFVILQISVSILSVDHFYFLMSNISYNFFSSSLCPLDLKKINFSLTNTETDEIKLYLIFVQKFSSSLVLQSSREP